LYEAARKSRSGKPVGAVDETATGSATFFGPIPSAPLSGATAFSSSKIAAMHPPRPPSIDQGVIAALWAFFLSVFIFFGLLAVGETRATAIVLALLSFAGIWLLVRLRGEDTPVRRRRR
jgi:hypothetical protein